MGIGQGNKVPEIVPGTDGETTEPVAVLTSETPAPEALKPQKRRSHKAQNPQSVLGESTFKYIQLSRLSRPIFESHPALEMAPYPSSLRRHALDGRLNLEATLAICEMAPPIVHATGRFLDPYIVLANYDSVELARLRLDPQARVLCRVLKEPRPATVSFLYWVDYFAKPYLTGTLPGGEGWRKQALNIWYQKAKRVPKSKAISWSKIFDLSTIERMLKPPKEPDQLLTEVETKANEGDKTTASIEVDPEPKVGIRSGDIDESQKN